MKNCLKDCTKTYLSKLRKRFNISNENEINNEELEKYILEFPIRKSKSVESGNLYEKNVYSIVSKLKFKTNNEKFNNNSQLGGSSSKCDLICNHRNQNINIELKNNNNPEIIQCSLYKSDNIWKGKKTNIFDDILKDVELFNNLLPQFFENSITSEEWEKVKKNFPEITIQGPNNLPCKLLKDKNIHYIQINKRGLFCIDEDICDFGVPKFEPENVHLRIRVKKHTTKNKNGFCNLSVMASCVSRQINTSPFSLDTKEKIPNNLVEI